MTRYRFNKQFLDCLDELVGKLYCPPNGIKLKDNDFFNGLKSLIDDPDFRESFLNSGCLIPYPEPETNKTDNPPPSVAEKEEK